MVVDKIFIAEHGQARLGVHGKIIQIFLIFVFSVNSVVNESFRRLA